MFTAFSRKIISWIFIITLSFTGFGFFLSYVVKAETSATPLDITVVIDAGHGGIDGGSIGEQTGVTECELNLLYANKLEKLLTSIGINVVKTRNSLDGLYDSGSDNLKKSDMQKRKEIIERANAQLVVSIHMNKFSLKSENGAQVFYSDENDNGKVLADSIRDELVKRIDNARKLTLAGNFFIVKCTDIPSVIVECGFLSNPAEELLLQQDEYQDRLCYSIFCGIIGYLHVANF